MKTTQHSHEILGVEEESRLAIGPNQVTKIQLTKTSEKRARVFLSLLHYEKRKTTCDDKDHHLNIYYSLFNSFIHKQLLLKATLEEAVNVNNRKKFKEEQKIYIFCDKYDI